MTVVDTYIPFDSGQGATATPANWRAMGRQFRYSGVVPGYANAFSATISAGKLTIQPGAAWIDGYYGEIISSKQVDSTGLGSGLVVLRLSTTARTITLTYLPGVTTPSQQTASPTYDIPLYYISTSTAFTDVRQFTTATSDWSTTRGQAFNNSNYCARGRVHRVGGYTTSTVTSNYNFDTVDYGGNFFSGYTFVCPYADDYLVISQVGFVANAAGQWTNMHLIHNSGNTSSSFWSGSSTSSAAGQVIICRISDIVACKAGDTLFIQHLCSTNGLQGAVGGYNPFMAVRAQS